MKLCPKCHNLHPVNYPLFPRVLGSVAERTSDIKPTQLLLGKYELLAMIGRGAMGAVYKARVVGSQRIVAIKVITAVPTSEEEVINRLRDAVMVASRLKHPNVIQIDDFGKTEDGWPFVVTEFAEGYLLLDAVRRHSAPWHVAPCLEIADQVADVLRVAHSVGIVHADINPFKILLLDTCPGRILIKVKDLGLRDIRRDLLISGVGLYVSPERLGGRPTDERSDIYQLGMILYEMLTGKFPFQPGISGMMSQATSAPAAPETVHSVPPMVSALVMKCLQPTPDLRFQTAEELLAAIRVAKAELNGEN